MVSVACGDNMFHITPNENITCTCAEIPCVTLDTFVEMLTQRSAENSEQTNNTTLIFMPGVHDLTITLHLEGVSNITFQGSQDLASRINVGLGNFTFANSKMLSFRNLVFESTEPGYANKVVMSFVASGEVALTSVRFDRNVAIGTMQQAIEAVDSDISLTDVAFTGFTGDNGGAITASNCTLTFTGNCSFTRNSALRSGGALYAESCLVHFNTKVTFHNNVAAKTGGAMTAIANSVVEFNGVSSFSNNFVASLDSEEHIPLHGGGAIALDTSFMVINSSVTFLSNRAPNGGAVLAYESSISSEMSARLTLANNMAILGDENSHINPADHSVENTSCVNSQHGELGGSIISNGSKIYLREAAFLNSSGRCGGSIYAIYSSLMLSGNTSFTFSAAEYDGGALYLNQTSLDQTGHTEISRCTAHLKGSALCFYKDRAHIWGHFAVRHCYQTRDRELDGTIHVEWSSFTFSGHTVIEHNLAHEGGGIYASDSTVTFSNHSTFVRNSAGLNGGAIYLERSRIAMLDEVILRNNAASVQGGGVYGSIGSVVFLMGVAMYEGNTAGDGGVFALENGVSMITAPPLRVVALHNAAVMNGGVIFYTDVISTTDCAVRSHSNLRPLPVCFLEINSSLPFDLTSLDIRLNFTKNSAGNSGSVLYGGAFTSCRMLVSETLDLNLLDNKCQIIEDGHYEDNPFQIIMSLSDPTPDRLSIGSVPLRICFCNESGSPDCDFSSLKKVNVSRGETFRLSAVTVGQANGPTPSTIRMANIDSSVEINSHQQAQKTGNECTDIFYQLYTTLPFFTLVLYPDGPCRDTGIARKEVQVTLLPCPDGFNLSATQTECVCEKRLQLLNATCHIDTRHIETEGGMWLKPKYNENGEYEGVIIHPYCPFDYCVNSRINATLDDTDVLCNYNRTGWLCGSCSTNYSLALGSFHCLKCTNNYLLLLIPFSLAGILLVVFLLVLDLTIAKGTINGLILYANIVQANKAVFLPKNERNILTVFIAWLNLDLGIESCFFDGLTAYQHAWLQYAFPLYLWLLISLIALFSHKSRTISKLFGTNPVAVLATLLLMSYAKVLQTIITALSRTLIDTPTGNRAVWTYDGNVGYLSSVDHIVLATVAMVALLFLFLPFNLLLMFGWKLQYHSSRKIFSWINKIKPFMDTIYGPFRTETRYWTGLLLLIRCILFLTFTFNGQSLNAGSNTSINLLAILSVFAGLAVLAWLSGRIYNTLYADILEAASILNVCLFAAATYHVEIAEGNQALLAHVSISIAFALFIGVVLFHAYLRLEGMTFWKMLRVELTLKEWSQKLICRVSRQQKKIEDAGNGQQEALEMSGEPSITYITLREPLLEN